MLWTAKRAIPAPKIIIIIIMIIIEVIVVLVVAVAASVVDFLLQAAICREFIHDTITTFVPNLRHSFCFSCLIKHLFSQSCWSQTQNLMSLGAFLFSVRKLCAFNQPVVEIVYIE